MKNYIIPQWQVPDHVKSCVTTRIDGAGAPPYGSFNIACHVDDDPEAVAANRRKLSSDLGLPGEPVWLEQIHSSIVVPIKSIPYFDKPPRADGLFTDQKGVVLAVMTADCLPILLSNREGSKIAALHGGWKGLAGGIIEEAIQRFFLDDISAWLGPAISVDNFEVGAEVREIFVDKYPFLEKAFFPGEREGKFFMDIYKTAEGILNRFECRNVFGGGFCTFKDSHRFFSYRRESVTGRMASLIWID